MTSARRNPERIQCDVAVIGGGAAGLTAAVTLGRARRSVVVVDSGEPRNAPAEGVHMFLTRDGITPAEFRRLGRAEAESYGARLIDGAAVAARRVGADFGVVGFEGTDFEDDGFEATGVEGTRFEVTLADDTVVNARRLLVTTGLVDVLPDVPGLHELWGRDVHHCPYCHGHELHGHAVGVLGSGPMAVHQALMFRQWVSDLVFFVHTAPEPTAEQAEQLAARGIQVISGRVDSLQILDGHLAGVQMADGSVVARRSLVVGPRFVARSAVLTSLGLASTPHPMGFGEFIPSDPSGLTAIPGVWVAGNVTDLSAGVVVAAAGGMTAGAAVNADLIAEETAKAVAVYRESIVIGAAVQHVR